MSNSDDWKNQIAGPLLGIIIGGILTTASQYYINYKGIEEPKIIIEKMKINLELKKTALDVQKQSLSLTPNFETTCSSTHRDRWTWIVNCTSKNNGLYPAVASIDSVRLRQRQESTEAEYNSGTGYSIEFPSKKNQFLSPPGTEGDIWYYVRFDKKAYPQGFLNEGTSAISEVKYETIKSAQDYYVDQFPELKNIISTISNRGISPATLLPQ